MSGCVFQPFPMLPNRRAQAWRYRPEFRRPRHFHREPELNFIVRGTATLGLGTRTEHAVAGSVVMFEPGQDHELLAASPDLELFALALTPELWERVRSVRLGLPSEASAWPEPNAERAASVLGSVGELRDAADVETRLGELFFGLQSAASVRSLSSISRRATERAAVAPGAACSALASQLGTHPSNLSRVVVRDLGVSLVELRSRSKLSEFVRLVDLGQSFTQAALAADFGSYAQCHRVFRRLTGCSPSSYFSGGRLRIDHRTVPSG